MVEVRGLASDEWAVLRDVRLAALTESPRMFGSTLERELGFDMATWRARTATSALAWDLDEPVGIVGWTWTDHPKRLADLISMWVAPQARGHGIGTALVRWVIDQAVTNSVATLELGVVRDNVSALRLYRGLGFVETGSDIGAHSGDQLLRLRLVRQLKS